MKNVLELAVGKLAEAGERGKDEKLDSGCEGASIIAFPSRIS
jgi:hypothetical protein